MATTVQDIQAKLDEVQTGLDAVAADEDALKAQIQALQDRINQGAGVTADQLQEVMDKASAIADRVRAIDVSVS